MLNISSRLQLPDNAVTQKIAFLGRTGSGKTYAASKLAEEMLAIDAQIVVLDPVGIWFSLRLAANGRDVGLGIPVFGGLHADVPLEPTAGTLLANVIVDDNISAVLDMSQMTSAEQARFATDFASRLFERRKAKPSAMMLFLEECQEFIPQNPMKGEERLVHAFQRLVKIGRNFGIGAALITQRPQEVSKKVLNMTECLFAFQMTGPQERKAIREWVADKGLDLDIVDLLPKLPVGEAHVWSPQWLKISELIKIAAKKTFDGSRTPEVGKAAKTKTLPPIALDQLRAQMAQTIERAKADDPQELRRVISALQKELAVKGKAAVDDVQLKQRVDSALAKQAAAHGKRLDAIADAVSRLQVAVETARSGTAGTQATVAAAASRATQSVGADEPHLTTSTEYLRSVWGGRQAAPLPGRAPVREKNAASATPAGSVTGAKRRMLVALAQRSPLSAKQLGLRAGLASSGGSFGTYLSALRSDGLIEGNRAAFLVTEHGRLALGEYEPLPVGTELLRYWQRQLGSGGGAARMLQVLLENHGGLDRVTLGERAEVAASGGSFGTYLSKLRTLELVTVRGGMIALSEDLRD